MKVRYKSHYAVGVICVLLFVLCSTLSGVREASLNATSASRGVSDISANIQQAEDVALSFSQNASYALNLVSQSNKLRINLKLGGLNLGVVF